MIEIKNLIDMGFKRVYCENHDPYTNEKLQDRIFYEMKHSHLGITISHEPESERNNWYLTIKINDDSYYHARLHLDTKDELAVLLKVLEISKANKIKRNKEK